MNLIDRTVKRFHLALKGLTIADATGLDGVRVMLLAEHPLLLRNPRMRQLKLAVPDTWLPSISRMADQMESTLERLQAEGLANEDLPVVLDIADRDGRLEVLIENVPENAKSQFRNAVSSAQAEILALDLGNEAN
ncbi:MAG TPA: hypothetical protein PLQ95_06915 [Thiobacillus sp.]|nr:hypothetical protein [Thiobacillus sp.]